MAFRMGQHVAALLLLASNVLGHIYITNPVPFDAANIALDPLKVGAIGASGTNYPCQVPVGGGGGYSYTITQMNNMAVGQPQNLSFHGSASHGGGTCQLAVSLDTEPSPTSVWKIIQVFQGGCPISADGNDGTHPFTYVIPENFPNGQATLSWTWYNRIGNREIYMNCAPITVTGGSDSKDYYNSLPNLYLVNMEPSDCATPENEDVLIPYPGQFIMTGGATPAASALGAGCSASAAAQTSGVTGYQSSVVADGAAYSAPAAGAANAVVPTSAAASAATTTSQAAQSTSAVYSSPAAAASSSSPAAVYSSAPVYNSPSAAASSSSAVAMSTVYAFSTITASTPLASQTSAYASPSAAVSSAIDASPSAAASSSAPAAASSGSASTGSTGTTPSGTSTCTTNGAMVCNGPNQFGLCNFGTVVWQAVAAGTTCSNGQITKRSDWRDVKVRRAEQELEAREEWERVRARMVDMEHCDDEDDDVEEVVGVLDD